MFMHYVFNALKLVQILREQLNRTMLITTCKTQAKFKLEELLILQLNIHFNYLLGNEPSPGAPRFGPSCNVAMSEYLTPLSVTLFLYLL